MDSRATTNHVAERSEAERVRQVRTTWGTNDNVDNAVPIAPRTVMTIESIRASPGRRASLQRIARLDRSCHPSACRARTIMPCYTAFYVTTRAYRLPHRRNRGDTL